MEDMNLKTTKAILQTSAIFEKFWSPSIELQSDGTNVRSTWPHYWAGFLNGPKQEPKCEIFRGIYIPLICSQKSFFE